MKMPRKSLLITLGLVLLMLVFQTLQNFTGLDYWLDVVFAAFILWLGVYVMSVISIGYLKSRTRKNDPDLTDLPERPEPDRKLQFDAFKHLTTLNVLMLAGLATVFPFLKHRFEIAPVGNAIFWGSSFILLCIILLAVFRQTL